MPTKRPSGDAIANHVLLPSFLLFRKIHNFPRNSPADFTQYMSERSVLKPQR
jgi:hypothetical protein